MNDKYVTFFVSTDAHDRLMRRMWKQIGKCRGGVIALSVLSGLLLALASEQKRRIDELEERVKSIEMAG